MQKKLIIVWTPFGKFKDCKTSREHELTQYLQNPEKTAALKEILQASKPSGHIAYVCKVDLADIILSAETAALEDGLINALQHHSVSIRSILGTATNG
jgi:hypothetical protein